MKFRVFLDANGTTPLRSEVRQAMIAAMDTGGNASSVHSEGRAARDFVDEARFELAKLASVKGEQVIFTSGGSESNRTALQPGLCIRGRPAVSTLFCSAVEHPSVLFGGGFPHDAIQLIPVDQSGRVDLDWLAARLAEKSDVGACALVSVMMANNETGVVQPIEAVGELCRRYGQIFHCDAAQALGRMPLDKLWRSADLVTLTGHKAGGPIGIGALLIMREGLQLPQALIGGGGQERGLRAGTENIVAIAGFSALLKRLEVGLLAEIDFMCRCQSKLETALLKLCPRGHIPGHETIRLPNTTSFWWPEIQAETALIKLDMAGLAISSGAACASGKVAQSHVLKAMGVQPASALRFSTSWATCDSDIDRAIDILSRSMIF